MLIEYLQSRNFGFRAMRFEYTTFLRLGILRGIASFAVRWKLESSEKKMLDYSDKKERKKMASLYIWNLDTEMKEPELFHFIRGGFSADSLISVEIFRDARNRSLGRGRAIFGNREDARKSIITLSSLAVSDSPPKMAIDSFPPHVVFDDEVRGHDVYVGNMSSSTTLESLKDEFTSYGTVLHAKIEQKSDDEFFGFVKYENPDHRFGAITHLNGKVVDGKAWTVSHVYKMENKLERHDRIKQAMDEERVLYVSNLCCQVKDSDLENVFGGFGDVIACHIRRHHDGRSKGDAFIEYATKESVVKAMSAMEGKSIWEDVSTWG